MTADDDAWGGLGATTTPAHPEAGGVPLCPTCGQHHDIAPNTGIAGGLICWHCMTLFRSAPGEWAATAGRRDLWGREYEQGPT